MRKIILLFTGAAILGVSAFCWFSPCTKSQDISDEKLAYATLFNQKSAEILAFNRKEGDGKDQFSPDQFYLFDKLKRMNPVTGEVPVDGLSKAWHKLVEMFGDDILPTQKGSNYGLQWEERGPSNVGGRTRTAMFDPNDPTDKACFAGGVGGGLWYTTDITVASPVWVSVNPIFSNIAVTALTYDPTNPQVMFFGTGEGYQNADGIRGAGLWKSIDGGMTWSVLPATENSNFHFCLRLQMTQAGDLYVSTRSGLWKSTDQGASFYKVLGQGAVAGNDWITDMEIAGDGDLYVASSSSGIYRSETSLGTNQGELGQWTRLSAPLGSGFARIEIAVGKAQPDMIYAVAEIGFGTGDIIKSTNGGDTWSITSGQPNGGSDYSNGQAWYDLSFEVNPTNANEVFTGGLHIYRTTDAGASWNRRTSGGGGGLPYVHVDQHGVFYRPNHPTNILFSNDGGLYLSQDGGNSFDDKNTGYNTTQFYSISVDPRPSADILIGGTQDNGSWLITGSGINPATKLTGADGSFCAIDHQRPDTMYTTYQYATVLRSRDGGANFTNLTNANLTQNDVLFINPLEIDVNDPNLVYQAARALWRHNNAGGGSASGWTQATKGLNTAITAITSAPSQPYLCYFAAGGVIYRVPFVNTTNSTTVPQSVNSGGNGGGYVSCLVVNPNDENHIVLTYASYGVASRVLECRDAQLGAAATWRDLTGNLPDMPINWAVFEPNSTRGMLIGTDLGVFRCTDIDLPSNQIWWNPERLGMGCPRVDMLEVRAADNSVHAATHGRGFFSTYSYNQVPVANFGIAQDSACGGFVQFVDSSTNVPNSWSWDFGDGGTSTTGNPVHLYAASGTYVVSLTVSNPNGSDSYTQSVTVTVLPSVNASAGADISVCTGDSAQLVATGGTIYTWFPTSGLSNPNVANPKYFVNGTREFVVTVTNAAGCTDIDTIKVTALAKPNVWAGPDQTVSAPNDSVQLIATGATTFVWTPATGLSCTTCANPKALPAVTTTYSVTGTSSGGCSNTDAVIVNAYTVGIDDALNQSGAKFLSLTPNPVRDHSELRFELAKPGKVSVEVLSLEGKAIQHFELGTKPGGTHAFRWNTAESGISSGVYFIALTVDGYRMVKKAIVAQ